MKSSSSRKGNEALTSMEALVIISVVAFVSLMLGPALFYRDQRVSVKINCTSNLKQTALAFRIWEGDNSDLFPMKFYTNTLGEPLFPNVFQYLQPMSNELNNVKVVLCPLDKKRSAASNFTSDFDDTHISYFVGLQADETMPQAFLAGDRNLESGIKPLNGILALTTNQPVRWTKEMHVNAGNVALCDGSVQQFSNAGLVNALKQTGLATNRLLFPQ